MGVADYQSLDIMTGERPNPNLSPKQALNEPFKTNPSTRAQGIGPGCNTHGTRLVRRLPPPEEGGQRGCVLASVKFVVRG